RSRGRAHARAYDPFRPWSRSTKPSTKAFARGLNSSLAPNQLPDRRLERTFRCAIIAPRLALAQQGPRGRDREPRGVETVAHLAPTYRHRYRCTRTPARRQRSNGRRHAVVAQEVEENAPLPLPLRHADQVAVGAVGGHAGADGLGERLGLLPADGAVRLRLQRRDDVQALASRGLAERDEPKGFEALAHLLGRRNHLGESDVGVRIEIEDQTTGNGGMVRSAVPGIELHGGDLRHGDQTFDPVDLQI